MPKEDNDTTRTKRAQVVVRELKRIFPGNLQTPLNYSTPFELLVAVMLSAQTTDKKVNEVTPALFEKLPAPEAFAKVSSTSLESLIQEIGFHRTKARNLRATAARLVELYQGEVPLNFDELLALPGVGRKTAHVVLGHLTSEVQGVAVDTHVKRLAKKFGLTDSSNADIIERDLMKVLPRQEWWDTAYRLKAYGREISPARRSYDDPIYLKLKKNGLL